jgi:hypothetical protein
MIPASVQPADATSGEPTDRAPDIVVMALCERLEVDDE